MKLLDIADIIEKLLDLRTCRPELARRMPHEKELPDDAVPYLIERVEAAFAACQNITPKTKAVIFSELTTWLIISHNFYLIRLVREENPWTFTYPKSELHTCH